MVAEKLRAAIETRIFNNLKKEFAAEGKGNEKEAEKSWKRQAAALADIALDIVQFLQSDVQVAAGISVTTAGSPSAQSGATSSPGKLV
jgi:hypothetical protein